MKKRKMLSRVAAAGVAAAVAAGSLGVYAAPETGAAPAADFTARMTYAQIEQLFSDLHTAYPEYSEYESIGKTYQNRDIHCLTITDESVPDSEKTGIGVFANIHGGERESGASAVYTAWWLLSQSEGNATVEEILDKHIVYVIPVINPDGYEQSFINNNRSNLRPNDHNGDGTNNNDPYRDIDGDGYVGTVYAASGPAAGGVYPQTVTTGRLGSESPDADGNGLLGDDPNGYIDLNRNFDAEWWNDDKTAGNPGTTGEYPASELETQAVQKFIDTHPMDALTSLHTGIQCVLYPWCYRPVDMINPDEVADIQFMANASEKMRSAFAETTQRNFYTKDSYNDYQTYSELIDYSYGKYGIHSYTIEVYNGGGNSAYDPNHDPSDDSNCTWNNTLPQPKWAYYAHDEIQSKLGLDPAALKVAADGAIRPLGEGEGLYIYTNSTAQMVDKAPEDQDILVEGAKDAILQMIYAEGKVQDPALTSDAPSSEPAPSGPSADPSAASAKASSAVSKNDSPKTGDAGVVPAAVSLAGLAGLAGLALSRRGRKG